VNIRPTRKQDNVLWVAVLIPFICWKYGSACGSGEYLLSSQDIRRWL